MKIQAKKKFTITLLVLLSTLVFALCGVLTACKKKEKPLPEPEDEGIVIKLSDVALSMNEYEDATITAKVTGSDGAVEWSSSDSSVATVENGVIYGVGEGTATITAKVSKTTSTCAVTVNRTPYAPKIRVPRAVTLEAGKSYQSVVYTEWNKQPLDETVNYTWSYADGSPEGVVMVEKGAYGKTTFTALKAGNAELYVSATVRGFYTNSKVSVRVIAAAVTFEPETAGIVPAKGSFEASLSTLNSGEYCNNVPLLFSVGVGGNVIPNAEIAWSVEDSDVAEIKEEGGTQYLYGKDEGETDVTGTYQYNGTPLYLTVRAKIAKPIFQLTEHPTFEVEDLKSYTITGSLLGDIVGAELNGVDVFQSASGKTLNLKKSALPKSASGLGEQVLTVISEKARYEMPVTLYTLIINNPAELDSMREIARANGDKIARPDGYFVLGNDIDYNGTYASMLDTGVVWGIAKDEGSSWTQVMKYGFKGVFDGMGYNIDGMTIEYNSAQSGGFIGYLNTVGVVRNVSFTNAVLTENQGFVCSVGDGLIENVYVKFKQIGSPDVATLNLASDPRRMGAFFSYYKGESATVNNCVVDALDAEIDYETAGSKNSLSLTTLAIKHENLILLCASTEYSNAAKADYRFNSYAELQADNGIANALVAASSVWKNAGGIPLFASVKAANDVTVSVTADKNTVYCGSETAIHINAEYVNISVSQLPAGVTFENGILAAASNATTGTVTITATSIINGTSNSVTVTISSITRLTIAEEHRKTIYLNVKLNGTNSAPKVNATGTENFDLTSQYTGSASSAKLEINGAEIGTVSLASGVASVNVANIPATAYGNITFEFYILGAENYCISYPVHLITWKVDGIGLNGSANDNNSFRAITQISEALGGGGYFLLTKDIALTWNLVVGSADDYRLGVAQPFVGTLDGDGHSVSGMILFSGSADTNRGFVQTLGAQGLIKNIAFINVYNGGRSAVVHGGSGTLENVLIKYGEFGCYSNKNFGAAYLWGGQLGTTTFGASTGDITLKNVVVDFTACTGFVAVTNVNETVWAFGTLGAGATVNNVAVFGLVKTRDARPINGNSGTSSGVHIHYTDNSDNGVSFPAAGWDNDYWTVDTVNHTVSFKLGS